MDIFNLEATESEKGFLKNRIRAIFGSTEMLVHGGIKGVIALLCFISIFIGSFSLVVSIMGTVFMAASSASTFWMFSKMQGERKYSPYAAKMYSILTLCENIIVKVGAGVYCIFIISAMFKRSLFGTLTQEAAVIPYKMGFGCIVVVIFTIYIASMVANYLKLQRRFAENVYDCVDAELLFYSTEKKYAFGSYIFALIVLIYNIFKMISPSWENMGIFPLNVSAYLDSGVIINSYNFLTFLALLLMSAHLVLSGRLAIKYISVVKKIEKRVKENHAR
jgi:hypothetical protein